MQLYNYNASQNRKLNLLETIKHNKYIGHRLHGVLYKIQQDDMFRST